MKKVALLLLLISLSIYSATVLSWVPPYDVDACKANLNADWGGYGPKDGLSHLALQFWVPNGSGGVILGTKYTESGVNASNIAVFKNWGNTNNIKIMLCIYNGESGWDWPLAVGAFKTHKLSTINALLSEVEKYGLDGVEIDLEKSGGGISTSDNDDFVAFLEALGDSLHSKGLELTVAAGANENLGPDWNLWDSMTPYVDAVTSMGYGFIGMNVENDDWKFSGQKAHINDPTKLLLGFPGYSSLWGGNSLVEHLTWVKNDGEVGVGIWDFKFNQAGWQTKEPWILLNQIRGALVTEYTITASSNVGGSISPLGEISVDSASSESFTITPDKWYLIDYVEVDGVNKGSASSYSFSDIKTDHTIKAFFKEDPTAPKLYSITSSANSNGSISPSGTITAASGEDKLFTVSPNSGYQVKKVLVDGIDRGPIISADINNISSDHSIEASFETASGGDLGKYEEWTSSTTCPPGDTVYWNDSLWAYTGDPNTGGGWGSDMEPTIALADKYGTPPWTYKGLYNGVADTLVTADLQYNSAIDGKDTLIITTTSKASGKIYATDIDTIILSASSIIVDNKFKNNLNKQITMNTKLLTIANSGTYKFTITDLRGRIVRSEKIKTNGLATIKLASYYQGLSKGLYLLSVSKGSLRVNGRVVIN